MHRSRAESSRLGLSKAHCVALLEPSWRAPMHPLQETREAGLALQGQAPGEVSVGAGAEPQSCRPPAPLERTWMC